MLSQPSMLDCQQNMNKLTSLGHAPLEATLQHGQLHPLRWTALNHNNIRLPHQTGQLRPQQHVQLFQLDAILKNKIGLEKLQTNLIHGTCRWVGRLNVHTNQVAHQAGACLSRLTSSFISSGSLGVFLLCLDGMLVHCKNKLTQNVFLEQILWQWEVVWVQKAC